WNWVSGRVRLGFNPFSSDGDGGRRQRRKKGRRSKAETKRERGTPGMAACGVARPFTGGRLSAESGFVGGVRLRRRRRQN
uniref:Uncharacterized protein n=1 Tax=Cucumis melo TaxID=3656 RepID=A0A9I9E308_CUCME